MRTEQITGILLAAGSSSRFGPDKLLHPLADGSTIAVVAARRLLAAIPHSIAIVRPGAEKLAVLLQEEGMATVVNPQPETGMAGSIVCGIQATRHACAWVIALADMPFIQSATIAQVVQHLRRGALASAPVYKGRRGHPVGFGAVLAEDLLALRGDNGAAPVLQRVSRPTLFETPDAMVLRDIDRIQDLNR